MIEEETIYDKLRIDVLMSIINERNIAFKVYKSRKSQIKEIIDLLVKDDNEKLIRDPIYEKSDNGYIVGLDIRDRNRLLQIGKIIEEKRGYSINQYFNSRVHFFVPNKLI